MTRHRTLAAAAVAVTLSLGAAGPSLARSASEPGRDTRNTSAEPAHPAGARDAARAEARARRKARFVAVGIVTGVGTNSITLDVKGGSAKDLRGKPAQSFTLSDDASVSRNGQEVNLDAIKPGDHAMVKGIRTGAVYTAHKVRAQSGEETPAAASSTPNSSS